MGARAALPPRPSPAERGAGSRDVLEMRSQVKWALLGLVIKRSGYGYELIQRFERAYGHSIELSSPSQIYVALDTLEARSLVKKVYREQDAQGSRQPKPRYHATPEGVLGYQEWLVAQVEQARTRSHMFVSQLVMLPPKRAIAVLDQYETACLEAASRTPAGAGEGLAEEGGALGLSERLSREDDRLTLDARLMWIQFARLQFEPKPAPGKRSAR